MICQVCSLMLRWQKGRQWRGTFDLHFQHHSNRRELQKSADMGCSICEVLWEELNRQDLNIQRGYIYSLADLYHTLYKIISGKSCQAETKLVDEGKGFTRAGLSHVRGPGWIGVYRLDFNYCQNAKHLGTFVLEPIGEYLGLLPST
jgi:hypothetical protein